MKDDEKLARTPASPSTPGGSTFVNPAEESRITKFWNDLQSINKDRATEENFANLSELGGIEALAEGLSVDLRRGIPQQELDIGLAGRRANNSMPKPPEKPFWRLYLESFEDPMLIVLVICAFVSLGIELPTHPETGWIDGTAILIAVNIVSTVTAINDYTKEKQFRKLNDVKDDIDVRVIRGGEHAVLKTGDLCVGDVVELETGDKIPADGVFIEGTDVESNESSLTGEPEDQRKGPDSDPFLLSGCQITAGKCTMLTIAVGPFSQWGRIKAKLAQPQKDTPLQEKLTEMAKLIGYLGTAAAVLTFTAQFIIWWVECPAQCGEGETMCPDRSCVSAATACPTCPSGEFQCWDNDLRALSTAVCRKDLGDCPTKVADKVTPCRPLNKTLATYMVDAFIIAVTVVVVAIPEGLPLAVTIALSYSTKKMLKDKNLIRQLAACETMGNATNICSDKTGTLTKNQMTVVEGWFAGKYAGESVQGAPVLPAASDLSATALDVVRDGSIINSTAKVFPPAEDGDGRPQVEGSKTEGAMIIMAEDMGVEWRTVRKEVDIERLYLFEARRKTMSTLVKRGDNDHRLYVKGASEIVLSKCTRALQEDGTTAPITEEQSTELHDLILGMAGRALRTIAVAYRDFGEGDDLPGDDDAPPEAELTLAAVVGIIDPLRDQVPAAVAACKSAGVRVRMVTGDNIHTACAIARDCGIYDEARGDVALEGPKFRDMTPTELDAVLPRLTVLARSSPEDKHTLVTRLNGKALPADEKEWEEAHPGRDWETERSKLLPGYLDEWKKVYKAGEVVGVTGDGTNDAPALKTADVGLSMGLAGTEVAKEASHIVIMDDNFASIVKAVRWGRCIYDNIRKFLQFQLTVNVVALTITFIGAVTGFEPPLNAVMMLWVNLIMDTLGALALATEPPRDELLKRFPYRRDAALVGRTMWRNILVQSAFQLVLLFTLLYAGQDIFALPRSGRENCKVYTVNSEDTVICAEHDYTHYTIIFNCFVFCQILNQFNARQLHSDPDVWSGLLDNFFFLAILSTEALMQVFMVYVAGDFMHTSPLTAGQFFASVGLAVITLPLGIVQRYVPPTTEDPEQFSGLEEKMEAEHLKESNKVNSPDEHA